MAAREEPVFVNGIYYDKYWKKNGCCRYQLRTHIEVEDYFEYSRFVLFRTRRNMNKEEAAEKFSFCKECEVTELLF